MIIKKNSQKYREVRRRIEPADFENKPVETAEIEPEEKELPVEQQEEAEEIAEPVVNLPKEPEIDLFDIENIDFNQRQERRRGSRRRGYRRIDDRNLVSRAQEEAETIKNLHLMKDTGKGWNRQRQIWLNLGKILLHLCMLQKMFLNILHLIYWK